MASRPMLYDHDLSAEGYAVRLALAVLAVDHEVTPVDLYPGREQDGPAFRAVNPRGRVPTYVDGSLTIDQVRPILIHLATRGPETSPWYPPGDADAIAGWFGMADDLHATAGRARLSASTGAPADIEACRAGARRALRDLDRHLWFAEREGRAWLLAGPGPTLADIAVFPPVILCEEGGISRQDYPAIRRWTDRVKRIPGFVAMPGVFPAGR